MIQKREWTQEDDDIIAMMVMDANREGKTNAVYTAIAAELGVDNPDCVRKRARELGLPNVRLNVQATDRQESRDYSLETLHIESEGLISTSDLHEPHIHREHFYEFLNEAQGYDIAIVGDIDNGDFFSHFSKRAYPDASDDPEVALRCSVEDISLMAEVAKYSNKRIYLIPGNHDFRKPAATNGGIGVWYGLQLALEKSLGDMVVFSSQPVATLNSDWVLIHPDAYRPTPGSVARSFAGVYEKNVLLGHSHITNLSFNPAGRLCIDVGGLVDERRESYRYYGAKPYGQWVNGWAIITPSGYTVHACGTKPLLAN